MTAAEPTKAMGKRLAVAVTLGIVLVIVGFIVLGTVLKLVPLYAGFLILWYFASVDVLEPRALPSLVVGAVCGAGTTWALQAATASGSALAIAAVLAVIVVAIWCTLVDWLPIAFNRAYMLYVTVMAAPLLQAGEHFQNVLIVIGLATLYFGGIAWIVRRALAARA